MRDPAYTERLQRHLTDYRARDLGVPAGVWGNPPREYGHILPRHDYQLNITEPVRAEFWRAQNQRQWKLHRYFHHLTSSQALAFNLFFPLYPALPSSFVETRRLLGVRAGGPASLNFEVELPAGDGTNIDVMMTDAEGRRTVIEVKLTEAAFGRASHDERHLKKLARTYEPLLRGRLADSCLEPAAFFRDYQLYRNLVQLRLGFGDHAVLLLPRGRSGLWQFAMDWCERQDLGSFRGLISVVALEDLFTAMEMDARSTGSDARPFQAAASKYLVPPP